MIELRHLQHALAVAKFRSFRKAADSLFLTQPTLTRSIQALEEALGIKIFDRGKRHVEPTPLGRVFLERSGDILKAAAELKREIDLARGLEIGHLHLGTGIGPVEFLIGPGVGRLTSHYPHLFIHIEVNNWAVLTELLQSGKIEFFVAESSEVEPVPDFFITLLSVFKIYIYCRHAHPLAGRQDLTLKEVLENYPLVMGKLPRRVLDSIAETCGIPKSLEALENQLPIIRCDYEAMHKSVIAASNAVGFAILPMIEPELRSEQVAILPVDFPECKSHAGIVQIRGRTLSPAAEVLIGFLRELEMDLVKRDQELFTQFFPKIGKRPAPPPKGSPDP